MKARVLIAFVFLVSITSLVALAPSAAQPIIVALPDTQSVSNGGRASDLGSLSADAPSSATLQALSEARPAVALTWKRSSLWTGNQAGPQDGTGRYWHHSSFDDGSWTPVSLPDTNFDTSADDRYYRAHFQWDGSSPVTVNFVSDDGLTIYINGQLLGTWGNGWRQSGCVNNIITCINYISVPTQSVPNSMLQPGDNVIAVDLWNAAACCFYYLDVAVNVGGAALSVSHMEVTQAIQNESNSVPLISGKPTLVRVYVDCGSSCTSLGNVIGGLQVSSPVGGISLIPRIITAYHPISWTEQRGDLRKTLNFLVPPGLLDGSVTFTAIVNGISHGETFTFQSARTVTVSYIPVRYEPAEGSGCTGGGEPTDRIRTAFSWAYSVYPTTRVDLIRLPTMPFSEALCGDSVDASKEELFNSLLRWNLQTNNMSTYVFGWLPDAGYSGGSAKVNMEEGTGRFLGGQVAFGDDDPSHGPRIFAHEVAHLLKRPHTKAGQAEECGNPSPKLWSDWPDPNSSRIQTWGIDLTTFQLKDPGGTHDYTSYCWYWNNEPAWTSPWTYEHIYSETLRIQSNILSSQSISDVSRQFIASGLVYTNNTATLDPVWVVTTTASVVNQPTGTGYCLEAQNISGTPLAAHCFDPMFMNHQTGEAKNVDGFTLMVPYPDGVARIVLKQGIDELAIRAVSANVPSVTVISPNGGESWPESGIVTITWSAGDADGDSLVYTVLYSPDGTNWVPIGMDLTTTQLTIDASELAGGTGAKVRVLASDGANTGFDESNTTFAVGSKGPLTFILSPEPNRRMMPDSELLLQGYASDLEDGTLSDTALLWSSDRDGPLGTGRQMLVTLSSGQHVVTLTATDSDGNSATASVNIFAGSKIYLPIVRRN